MYNLGLTVIQPRTKNNIQNTKQLVENLHVVNNHYTALINLLTIRSSLQKYGKTKQLTELVSESLENARIVFSNEGIGEAIANVINWIIEKLKGIWDDITGLFKNEKKSIDNVTVTIVTLKEQVAELKIENNEIEFEGIDRTVFEDVLKLVSKGNEISSHANNIIIAARTHTYDDSLQSSTDILNGYLDKFKTIQNNINLKMTIKQAFELSSLMTEKWKQRGLPEELEVKTFINSLVSQTKSLNANDSAAANKADILKKKVAALEVISDISNKIFHLLNTQLNKMEAATRAAIKEAKSKQ